MIKTIQSHIKKNKVLLKDNLILFLALFSANAVNYFFHFFVGRTLGPKEYSIFGVLLSIIYVLVLPLMAIQTTLSRFVTELNINNEKEKFTGKWNRVTLGSL